MSIYAELVSHQQKRTLFLGRVVRDSGKVNWFSSGPEYYPPNSEQPELTKALWKFLTDTAGETLVVKTEGDPGYDATAEYQEVGGDPEDGDISFDEYLHGFTG
jgi:hypothetical protein